MIKAIIVDDEKKGRGLLKVLLEKHCPEVTLAGEAASADEAYDLITKQLPDIVFLDIEMPKSSGFDLLQRFEEVSFAVIFITAYDKYAIKAFKFAAIDYLLKPVDEEELIKAVQKASQVKRTTDFNSEVKNLLNNLKKPVSAATQKIGLTTQTGLEFIEIKNIIRCEADGRYTLCYLNNGTHLMVTKNLKEFEDLLSDYNFFRIHHAHLVNLDYIKKYHSGRGGYVVMQDDTTISVSQRKKEEFLNSLKKI